MNNSKLIELLSTFSPKEMKQLSAYVSCDYFYASEQAVQLLTFLHSQHPEFSTAHLIKRQVYQRLFPNKIYSDQQLYEITSELYRLVENFLSQQQFNQQQNMRKKLLLTALREREQSRAFSISHKALGKSLDKNKHRNEDYYYNRFAMETEADHYFMQQAERKASDSLQNKVDYLDLFYLSAKLKNSCEMINRQNIVQADYSYYLMDEICQHIVENPEKYDSEPAIALYHQIYLTLTQSDTPNHYQKLVQLLAKHAHQFPNEEARGLYAYAQNYCIKKINSGDSSYLEEIFKLYQKQLEQHILFDQKKHISHLDYKNIVTVGLRLKAFEWTKKFIDTNCDYLPPNLKEAAYCFNMASYHFEQNDYRKCLQLLRTAQFKDVYYNLSIRALLLKVYYAQEDTDALYALIESFKIYLRRNKKVSDYQQEVYLNLVRLVKRLNQLRLTMPKRKTPRFLKEVETLKVRISTKQVANVNWLLEQTDMLTIA
jgi:hypothetical protein